MVPTAMLDAAVLRAWADGAVRALDEHRAELDALNVFPVADSDTGTNLYLTLREGRQGIAQGAGGEAAREFARGALVGARGNSGVIVSQYLGELLRAMPAGPLTTPALADGLRRATDAAYQAVARPVEGTVLTVARAVADGADAAASTGGPADVLAAAIAAGYEALARTPAQLAPLGAAGVLDAGGWGLLLVLGALAEALGAGPVAARPAAARPAGEDGASADEARHVGAVGRVGDGHDGHAHGDGPCPDVEQGGAFEVMFVVTAAERAAADDDVASRLRGGLAEVGDSVAVVGGDGLWQAHTHTDDPLAAVGSATAAGVLATQVRVRHIARQAGHGVHVAALGLVAVTGAAGLTADLARAGAVVVLVPPGQVAGPELERAVDDTGAATVVVLAADGLLAAAPDRADARVCDGLSEVQVVAGAATFAALASAGLGPEACAAHILAAVDDVRTAVADVGPDGDPGPVLAAARSLVTETTALLTVLAPDGAPDDLAARLSGVVGERVEVVLLATGLPGRAVVLGAECAAEPAGGRP